MRLNEKGEQGPRETGMGETFRIGYIGTGDLKNKLCSVVISSPYEKKII